MHFLTYVILGLQSLEAGTGEAAMTMLQSPQPPPIEPILINLLNDVSRVSADFVLVLDDYHLVDARPIHDMISFLLESQPEHLRNFLLHTSILGRLCGPLCDSVTRQQNGQQILDDLERANLFLIPLDDERRWYRYHHLFADLLEQRLRTQQGDLLPELHRRASMWFAQNNFLNEAVDHALVAQDNDRAVELIEEIAEVDWGRPWCKAAS